MKIKRKSVISVLLISAMIFSIAAFTSCNQAAKEVEFTVNMKITALPGTDIFNGSNAFENDLSMKGIADEITVLAATQRMCEILEIDFQYDSALNSVKKISSAVGDLFIDEYTVETTLGEGEEAAEGDEVPEEEEPTVEGEGEETTEEEAVKDFYYDWVCTVNGDEATPTDVIKEGDKIEWTYKEVKSEFEDKDRNE